MFAEEFRNPLAGVFSIHKDGQEQTHKLPPEFEMPSEENRLSDQPRFNPETERSISSSYGTKEQDLPADPILNFNRPQEANESESNSDQSMDQVLDNRPECDTPSTTENPESKDRITSIKLDPAADHDLQEDHKQEHEQPEDFTDHQSSQSLLQSDQEDLDSPKSVGVTCNLVKRKPNLKTGPTKHEAKVTKSNKISLPTSHPESSIYSLPKRYPNLSRRKLMRILKVKPSEIVKELKSRAIESSTEVLHLVPVIDLLKKDLNEIHPGLTDLLSGSQFAITDSPKLFVWKPKRLKDYIKGVLIVVFFLVLRCLEVVRFSKGEESKSQNIEKCTAFFKNLPKEIQENFPNAVIIAKNKLTQANVYRKLDDRYLSGRNHNKSTIDSRLMKVNLDSNDKLKKMLDEQMEKDGVKNDEVLPKVLDRYPLLKLILNLDRIKNFFNPKPSSKVLEPDHHNNQEVCSKASKSNKPAKSPRKPLLLYIDFEEGSQAPAKVK